MLTWMLMRHCLLPAQQRLLQFLLLLRSRLLQQWCCSRPCSMGQQHRCDMHQHCNHQATWMGAFSDHTDSSLKWVAYAGACPWHCPGARGSEQGGAPAAAVPAGR